MVAERGRVARGSCCARKRKYKQVLGGYKVYGKDAYIEKTFTDLPPHTALRIQATLYKIDRWYNRKFTVTLDGYEGWASREFGADRSGSECGGGGYNLGDRESTLDTTLDHFDSSAHVSISTTIGSGGVRGNGYYNEDRSCWGINNIRILVARHFPSPPAPPLNPGIWSEVASNAWLLGHGVSGWSGVPGGNITTNCGAFGTIVGGYGVFGVGAYIEKTVGASLFKPCPRTILSLWTRLTLCSPPFAVYQSTHSLGAADRARLHQDRFLAERAGAGLR